jgi:integrase
MRMSLPKVSVKPYKHSPTSKWVVSYPKDGKRTREFFKTKKEATTRQEQILVELENLGNKAFEIDDALRLEAVQCAERLAPFKHSLSDAVTFLISHLEASKKSCSVGELTTDYLATKSRKQNSDRYIRDLNYRLGRFNDAFHDKIAATVRASDIDHWIHGLGLSAQSMNNFRTVLNGLFTHALKHGFVSENPVSRIEKVKSKADPIQILTPGQLRKLLTVADPKIQSYIAIAAFAGLRIAELDKLAWEEVDLEGGYIEVKAANAKTSRRRLVEIQPNLQSWLFAQGDRKGKVKPANLRRLLDAAWQELEIGRARKNDFRHSFASYHYAMFNDPKRTAMELGHSDTSMLYQHYRELVPKTEAEKYWLTTRP